MAIRYAFVTLLTSDGYLPGALTIAAALKDVHRTDQTVEYETVCLVTPETVDVSSIRLLRKAFNVVIGVEVIVPPDAESNLTLLGRPDLDTALTKLHVVRLTQYSKVIFLDADVLPLRPLSHLFHLDHDFSAVPDVGWPDIFNSGVMVLSPSEDKFKELHDLLNTKGTWDGADQGLLNEWRGTDWNRLSFTYNTTPTAIYTYAPAYQRFGSQISVLHFIGPHKPWHSPRCAPGSSTQSTDMVADPATETSAPQHLYDYGSLVDRWYSVYDRHYRSYAAEPVFQPTKYTSAWNEEGTRDAGVAGGVLGLEELRRMAVEGMGASGVLAPRIYGEGEYRTMPLEGRFDLVRPQTRVERMQMKAQEDHTEAPAPSPLPTTPEPSTPVGQILSLPPGSPVRWTTLPTPGINDVPPAPHAQLVSLPSTPLRHAFTSRKATRITREAGAQTVSIQSQERESGISDLFQTSPVSNSSAETPSSGVTPALTDTYFPKIWGIDRNWPSVSPSSFETSLTTMEPSPSKSRPTSTALFTPQISVIPETLRNQGQYRDMVGEENGPSTPDHTMVKRVFPWEERPRHTPGRVFPDDGSPFNFSPLRRAPVSATPERKATFRSPIPSPLIGFPPPLQSHYAWDGLHPHRHANKGTWSASSPSPLGLVSGVDKAENDSQDGDVEDEVDSEEEAMMGSRSSSFEMTKRAPKYRSIGVQTDAKEVREEGIQVTTSTPITEVFVGTTSAPVVATTDISTSPPLPPLPDRHRPLLPPNLRDHRAALGAGSSSVISPTLPSKTVAGGTAPSHIRKGSRVWDPARGVDVFKRGPEEVLAKFMKVDS